MTAYRVHPGQPSAREAYRGAASDPYFDGRG